MSLFLLTKLANEDTVSTDLIYNQCDMLQVGHCQTAE